jgi:hypothetical protein
VLILSGDSDESSAPSVFNQARGSIQTAAKWIVGAAAVVVGTLIGGLQLKDLGPLLEGSLPRLLIAAAACLAAIIGAGAILLAAARVLITQGLTLSDIAQREVNIRVTRGPLEPDQQVSDFDPLLRSLSRRQRDLFPDDISDVLTFAQAYDKTREAAALVRRGEPAELKGVAYPPGDTSTKDLESQAEDYRERAEQLVDAAQMYLARQAFRRLIRTLWIGGSLTVIGVVVFVLTTATPPIMLVTTPTQVQVIIAKHPSQSDLMAAGLTQACAGRTLTGVAVGGSWDEPFVITYPASSCPARLFKVTRALGLAIPVLPTPKPT